MAETIATSLGRQRTRNPYVQDHRLLHHDKGRTQGNRMIGREPGGYDLGAMSDKLSRLAEDLQRTGERLQDAADGVADRTYVAASPDGLAQVSVNGRHRVTSIELSPYALREDPDTLDAVLTTTLNDALTQARSGSQSALLEGLPRNLRTGIEKAMDDTRREFRA